MAVIVDGRLTWAHGQPKLDLMASVADAARVAVALLAALVPHIFKPDATDLVDEETHLLDTIQSAISAGASQAGDYKSLLNNWYVRMPVTLSAAMAIFFLFLEAC